MKKTFIIHKTDRIPPVGFKHTDDRPLAECGTYSAYHYISATTNWDQVTCKKCLKSRDREIRLQRNFKAHSTKGATP